jgi:serine protease DegQ
MRQAPLYSRSPRASAKASTAPAVSATAEAVSPAPGPAPSASALSSSAAARPSRLRGWFRQQPRALWAAVLVLVVACGVLAGQALQPVRAPLTQKHIDAAVRRTLENEVMPSPYARAFAAIRQSVVQVQGSSEVETDDGGPVSKALTPGKTPSKNGRKDETPGAESNREARLTQSTGTGVVIIDNGTILTNLHVVLGAKRLKVTFADGHESEATLVSAEPEHDLAVLRAATIPDDLKAATMRSTGDLVPGDQVLAVGFPFGIGPSASAGVVSGLKREFRAPGGQRTLSNLIQFDAAANPGNSGGPLVTMDGSVVGIVTAILNPSEQRTFIGIGFAVPIESAAGAAGMPPF